MSAENAPQVHRLYTFPVKGLSGQLLPSVDLEAGRGFPADRIYGLARRSSERAMCHALYLGVFRTRGSRLLLGA